MVDSRLGEDPDHLDLRTKPTMKKKVHLELSSTTFLPCLDTFLANAQIIKTVSSMHLNNASGDWKLLKGKKKSQTAETAIPPTITESGSL